MRHRNYQHCFPLLAYPAWLPTSREIFDEFPDTFVNIDLKGADPNGILMRKVHDLIVDRQRETLTCWGSFNDKVVQACYASEQLMACCAPSIFLRLETHSTRWCSQPNHSCHVFCSPYGYAARAVLQWSVAVRTDVSEVKRCLPGCKNVCSCLIASFAAWHLLTLRLHACTARNSTSRFHYSQRRTCRRLPPMATAQTALAFARRPFDVR